MAYTYEVGTGAASLPVSLAISSPKGPATTAPTATDGNGVHTSDQAQFSAASGLVSGSDVRTAKVAQLQAAIASGTYQVSAGDVADKVIESLLG